MLSEKTRPLLQVSVRPARPPAPASVGSRDSRSGYVLDTAWPACACPRCAFRRVGACEGTRVCGHSGYSVSRHTCARTFAVPRRDPCRRYRVCEAPRDRLLLRWRGYSGVGRLARALALSSWPPCRHPCRRLPRVTHLRAILLIASAPAPGPFPYAGKNVAGSGAQSRAP